METDTVEPDKKKISLRLKMNRDLVKVMFRLPRPIIEYLRERAVEIESETGREITPTQLVREILTTDMKKHQAKKRKQSMT